MSRSLTLILRFALRELRGGLRGFGVFLACIALGVMAIAGVGSVARGMTEGVAREGRVILGGDISFSLVQRQANPDERKYLDRLGRVSEVATLRGMARRIDGSDQALVEVKAIDGAYPLFGAIALTKAAAGPLQQADGVYGGWAEPELLLRLGLKVGETIRLGAAEIAIRGVIANEPDRLASGSFSLGPRLMITRAALDESGLIQPGSLINWHYRVRLPGAPGDPAVTAIADAAGRDFPSAAWQTRTRADAAPGLRDNIRRFAEFLTLVGLTALVIGGVGVANAVASFLDGKRDVIATLKCLGAPAGFAVTVYLAEILIIAAFGIVAGLIAGAAIPFIAEAGLRRVVPVTLAGVYPLELALAALYGLVATLAFALYPLGRAREVSPTALFRDQVSPARVRPLLAYRLAVAAAVLTLAGLAIGLAFDRRVALTFVVAAAGAFLLLRGVAAGIMALARRAPRQRSTALRLALGNIHRPGALTPSVVLSLGLGLTLLVALVLIDGNFRRELFGSIPLNAPSFFFIDIAESDREAFTALVQKEAPQAKLELAPMLRGRIVKLAGVAAGEAAIDADAKWVLEGDRGITYADAPPTDNRIAAGKWWPAGYAGPPLVSFDAKIGAGLHLKLGDPVTVNVLGREVTATIASFREVEWKTLSMNSVMVFSPNAFRGAPFGSLATLAYPDGGTTAGEIGLLKAVSNAFPTIAAVRVKEAIATASALVSQIGWAVRGASAVTLLAAILVLGGAFAAGRHQRIHDVVVLKTLGATRPRLIGAFALEFLVLGLATVTFGLIAGAAAAWLVLSQIMDIGFQFLAAPALGGAALALILTLGFGLAGTWRVLGQKAAPILRNL
jgi:putative ABC transport system permease protein